MPNDDDMTTKRRGSTPPQKAEQIYHDWLKRPRLNGEASESGDSRDRAKKELDDNSVDKPKSANEARWLDDGGEGG